MQTTLAALGLFAATAFATSVGDAVVVNSCSYDVYLYNTPAADGGYTAIDEVLSSGGTYQQQWTELSNSDGWSIKLSKSTDLSSIMQYEYTFQDDGIIWYDLSDVNGNPWDGNWEITATGTCEPRQAAYRYATDDAYGMQACPQDSVITVTLCSGDDTSDSSSSAAASSSVASATSSSDWSTPSSSSVATSYSWAATSASTTSTVSASASWYNDAVYDSSTAAQTTTFATSTVASSSVVTTEAAGVTVTEVAEAVVTDVVTATHYNRWVRHEHGHRHAHA